MVCFVVTEVQLIDRLVTADFSSSGSLEITLLGPMRTTGPGYTADLVLYSTGPRT